MLKSDRENQWVETWDHQWKKTWDTALEPNIKRPGKIVDTYITHGSAHMFSAKYVYLKAEQVNDSTLSEDLKNLARRIALLGNDDIDEFLPTPRLHL